MTLSLAAAGSGLDDAQKLARLDTEHLLLPVLIQLTIIVVAARVCGAAVRKLGQPGVIGEIAAGILLGPSCFGMISPEAFAAIFRPSLPGIEPALANAVLARIFTVIAQLGLIFLLFLVGLELEVEQIRRHARSALFISFAGIVLPFLLGAGFALAIHTRLEPHPSGPVPALGIVLFMGVALAITAMPVLGRIMLELGITRTRLGSITLAAAALDDACGWILLASVAAVVKARFDPLDTLGMLGATLFFALVMFAAVRPLLLRYFRSSLNANGGRLSTNALAVLLAAIMLAAMATNLIGIFAVFGPFVLGAILSDSPQLREAASARMHDVVTTFFVPVFFTYTGLQTDLGQIGSAGMWWICGVLILISIAGKLLGCGLAARLNGHSWREAGIIGSMMNARGMMGLVAINVGAELGVIDRSLYTILVVMALVTTALTTPLLLWLRRGTEIDEPIQRSRFMNPSATSST
jgi:Kef-type K+ transport system membrane component KefB